jgi:hypothetical protein
MFGSHIDGARERRRLGSRYRYALVSAPICPGEVNSSGM